MDVKVVERRRYKVGDCVAGIEGGDVWRIADVSPDYKVQLWSGGWGRVLDAREVSEYLDSSDYIQTACPR